jgi:tyrosyl-tRNA synthetase
MNNLNECSASLGFRPMEEQISLITRGVAELFSESDLRVKLQSSIQDNKPLIVKLGVDPTAPDIHLGHTVVFRKLKHFQLLGHSIKFLIGDFTGRIGDPSGRDGTRLPLTEEEILFNAKTYLDQVTKILDKEMLEVVYNSTWLKNMTFEDVVRLAAQTTMSKLLEHNTFRKRFESSESIRMHEFLYPFMQGYDSVALKADVELGGTDQTFNLTFGRELQKSFGQEPQVCLTMPILVGTDGIQKMSKSLGNYIGIDEPPSVMFEKVMRMNDTNIVPYFTLLTDVAIEEINDIEKALANNPITTTIIELKKRLAKIIVSQYHGDNHAEQALKDYGKTDKSGIPTFQLSIIGQDSKSEIGIVELLMCLFGFKSKAECRRLIEPGAVKIDEVKITNSEELIQLKEGVIIKAGKNNIVKLIQ